MFCNMCGKIVEPESGFCKHCGAALMRDSSIVNPVKKDSRKIIAAILSVTLGIVTIMTIAVNLVIKPLLQFTDQKDESTYSIPDIVASRSSSTSDNIKDNNTDYLKNSTSSMIDIKDLFIGGGLEISKITADLNSLGYDTTIREEGAYVSVSLGESSPDKGMELFYIFPGYGNSFLDDVDHIADSVLFGMNPAIANYITLNSEITPYMSEADVFNVSQSSNEVVDKREDVFESDGQYIRRIVLIYNDYQVVYMFNNSTGERIVTSVYYDYYSSDSESDVVLENIPDNLMNLSTYLNRPLGDLIFDWVLIGGTVDSENSVDGSSVILYYDDEFFMAVGAGDMPGRHDEALIHTIHTQNNRTDNYITALNEYLTPKFNYDDIMRYIDVKGETYLDIEADGNAEWFGDTATILQIFYDDPVIGKYNIEYISMNDENGHPVPDYDVIIKVA